MKAFFLSPVVFFVMLQLCLAQNSFEIKSIRPITSKTKTFADSPAPGGDCEILSEYIKEGRWYMLKNYFKNEAEYTAFINQFALTENEKNKNESYPAYLKPYVYQSLEGCTVKLLNVKDKSTASITLSLSKENGFIKINAAEVAFTPSAAGSFNKTAATTATTFAYVQLPTMASEKPKYMNNYLDAYTNEKTITVNPDKGVPFRQIDFQALSIEFKWCKKIGFVNVCGTDIKKFSYGQVITGKDIPGNETTFADKYFGNVADIAAFSTALGANEFNPNNRNYILSSVIVDDVFRKLVFFREGLEPWEYGKNSPDEKFNKPIAVKALGNYLYVLDQGYTSDNWVVKVFQVYNTVVPNSSTGGFGVNFIGSFNNQKLGVQISSPVDLGGFEAGSNYILIPHKMGLTSVQLDNVTGMPLLTGGTKFFQKGTDPTVANKFYSFGNIKKIDARKSVGGDAGAVVIITEDNEILSFTNSAITGGTTNSLNLSYAYEMTFASRLSNLAYMFTEQKWYLTDYYGAIHTLTKDGRYIGGGGKSGVADGGGELYKPNAITPNPIEDPANEYRYRFLVANEWGYETGFKLFSPGINFPDFKIFEEMASKNLVFSFTTSGKWQYVEKGRGMSFSNMKINGTSISANLWNTQILPGTATSPGNDLTGYPNLIKIAPSSLSLKRGWNKVEISLTIFKEGAPDEVVSRLMDLYWLPSAFTPGTDLSNNKYKLNESSVVGGQSVDYIYKPITVGNKGALTVSNGVVLVTNQGDLNFDSGSTLYVENTSTDKRTGLQMDTDGKLTVKTSAFLCVKDNAGTASADPGLFFENKSQNVILQTNYSTGVNPTVPFPTGTGGSCKSPCYFLSENAPQVKFTSIVTNPSVGVINVAVDPAGTSYSDFYNWKIEKIVPAGQPAITVNKTFQGSAVPVNLSQALGFTFQACSQYNVTLSIGCAATGIVKSSTMFVNTSPVVNAGPDESFCRTYSGVALTGYSPAGGTWSGYAVGASGTFYTGIEILNTNIDLTYTYTDIQGCKVSDTKTVIVRPIPAAPALSMNTPICMGSTLNLSGPALANTIYLWTGPDNLTINTSNADSKIYETTARHAGSYTLAVRVNGCTSPVTSKTLEVLAEPLVNAGPDEDKCYTNIQYSLTGSPWGGSWSGNGVVSGGFNPVTAGFGSHTLTYNYIYGLNCSKKDTRIINVGPVVSAGDNQKACLNQSSLTLTGQTPVGGTWSGSTAVSSSGVYTPAMAGVGTRALTYTYQNALGCKASATKLVTVFAAPSSPYVSGTGPVCVGSTVTLSAANVFNAPTTAPYTCSTSCLTENFPYHNKWGSLGTYNGQFNAPRGIAINAFGDVYVSDSKNSRIQKFNNAGTFISSWDGSAAGGKLLYPQGIAIAKDGSVYIADAGNHCIKKYTSTGTFVTKWGTFGSANGQFNTPGYLAFDANGNVYVSDVNNHRIQKFSSNGVFISTWGSYGTTNGAFNWPSGIAIDASGFVYAGDASNRIQKFDKEGVYQMQWGNSGAGNGQFNLPQTLVFDADGNLFVTDLINQRIQVFNSKGGYITQFGCAGVCDGQFNKPYSIAFDQIGKIYIADTYNHRIQVFVTKVKYEWTGPNSYKSTLQKNYIYNIASVQAGTYYVSASINGCKSSLAPIGVSVNPIPSITTGTYSPVCTNSVPVTLSAAPQGGVWTGNGISTIAQPEFNDNFTGTVLSSKWTRVDKDNYTGGGVTQNGTLTIDGRGAGMNSSYSEFSGVSRSDIPGDFDVSVKIVSQTNSGTTAKAGIMVANNVTNLGSGGYCFVAVQPSASSSFTFQYDVSGTVGLVDGSFSMGAVTYPCWLRLKKDRTSFTAYYRVAETAAWSQLASARIPQFTAVNSQLCLFSSSANTLANSVVVMDDFIANRSKTTFTPSAALAGTNYPKYSLTVNNCADSKTTSIEVQPVAGVQIISASPNRVSIKDFIKADLVASPAGLPPFTFQWTKNGMNITGATTQFYSATEPGYYSVIVVSNCGTASASFNLEIYNGWKDIAIGSNSSAGIKDDGTLWTWGYNSSGQLGTNMTPAMSNLPVMVGTDRDWDKISVGGDFCMALKKDGSLWGWGRNNYGQLGDGTTTNKSIPVKMGTATWKMISLGFVHVLAIKNDGTLWSWGYNAHGQLGDGSTYTNSNPTMISSLQDWQQVAAGCYHSLALRGSGAYAWGFNEYGEVGDGMTSFPRSTPVLIKTDITEIATGNQHSAIIDKDGILYTFGLNNYGQLGDGTKNPLYVPTRINTVQKARNIKCGGFHTSFINENGQLVACGSNVYGEFGNGTSLNSDVFVTTNIKNIFARASGWSSNLFVFNDKREFVCGTGANSTGMLGIGSTLFTFYSVTCSYGAPTVQRTSVYELGNEQSSIEISDDQNNLSASIKAVPNPALDQTSFIYSIPTGTDITSAKVILYDLVKTNGIKEYPLPNNSYKGVLPVDLADFAAGVYPYVLIVNDVRVGIGKMVIVK